ncbi:hypothetical protein DL764_004002 [Monosporascus ibericus]|uniref:3-carboxy-cis,cis-mucoante lactonizing enzyme n=1 Tax=Monosporascus ibericus TaxID=155417 RepID=A0A4Q4TF13_9PEZI|nr:hypothetical protein DL764_004002 [Monosporascus ibericus]
MLNYIYLSCFLAVTYARVHHLIVGNLVSPASLYVLEFDDESLDLRIVSNNSAHSPHAWITFGKQTKEFIYGASLNSPTIARYKLTTDSGNSSTLQLRLTGSAVNCGGQTSAFVLAGQQPPFDVYSASWPGPQACGAAFPASARDDDLGGGPRYTWDYGASSGIHGLALGANGTTLYSADLKGNSVWTHRFVGAAAIDGGGGVGGGGGIEEVGRLFARDESGPRHLVVHPAGRYLHVIMETANELVTYELDGDAREPRREASVFSVIPEAHSPRPTVNPRTRALLGLNSTSYWAAEVALSPSGRYLWASTRAHAASEVGYLSMFELDADGAVVPAGRPGSGAGPWGKGPLFIVPTTTPGGIANSVSPAPWSDEFVAMTDFRTGYVQIWKMTTKKMDGAMDKVGAAAVARVDIPDGGCCANVIWYD